MNTQVGANTFSGTGDVGLFLDGNGINLGTNGINKLQGNRWTGTYSNLAARHSGTDPLFSPFLVNDDPSVPCGDPAYLPNSSGTASVTPDWFTSVPACLNACGTQTLIGGGGGLDDLDKKIIDGTFVQTGQSPASGWHSRYAEYRKIADNPALYSNNVTASGFLNSLQGTTIARFYAFEQLITEGMNYSPTVRANLETLYTDYAARHDVVMSAHQAYLATLTNANLWNDYTNAVLTYNSTQEKINEWLDAGEQEKAPKIAQAEALNNQVNPTNSLEASLRNVNTLRIKRYKNQAFTAEDMMELEKIAFQCYEEVGQAIYFARTLLPDLDANGNPYVFPDEKKCNQDRSQPVTGQPQLTSQVSLYPNPVESELTISGLGTLKTPVICRIFDLFGQLAQQTTLAGDGILSFRTLAPGTYILQLLTDDGQMLTSHKVIKTGE